MRNQPFGKRLIFNTYLSYIEIYFKVGYSAQTRVLLAVLIAILISCCKMFNKKELKSTWLIDVCKVLFNIQLLTFKDAKSNEV